MRTNPFSDEFLTANAKPPNHFWAIATPEPPPQHGRLLGGTRRGWTWREEQARAATMHGGWHKEKGAKESGRSPALPRLPPRPLFRRPSCCHEGRPFVSPKLSPRWIVECFPDLSFGPHRNRPGSDRVALSSCAIYTPPVTNGVPWMAQRPEWPRKSDVSQVL